MFFEVAAAGVASEDIAVSDDGLSVSTIVNGKLDYWRAGHESLILNVQGGALGPLAMSGDGQYVAVADSARRTQLWRIQAPQQTGAAVSPTDAEVRAIEEERGAATANATAAAASASASAPVAPPEPSARKLKKEASKKPGNRGGIDATSPPPGGVATNVPGPLPKHDEPAGNQGTTPSSPTIEALPAEQDRSMRGNTAGEDYHVVASRRPTGTRGSMGANYEFTFRLDEPPDKLAAIERVVYHMEHPTFKQKDYLATDRSSGFSQRYLGWGCLADVLVTIYYRDRPPREIHWNMCESLSKQRSATAN
jgi:hypothetical protein